jgi:hypothetical protein
MATNEEVLAPKVLIVPQFAGTATLPKGSLFISGAKLYVTTAVGTNELVTSA